MSELLKNSKRMADLATRGRLHVKKHFSVEHMVESYSKVYLSMLHLNQKASVGS
jgi:glycosyltransferase involved in cell wall biosynthesis